MAFVFALAAKQKRNKTYEQNNGSSWIIFFTTFTVIQILNDNDQT